MTTQKAAILIVVFIAGWIINGWRLDLQFTEYREQQAQLLAEARKQAAHKVSRLQIELAELDQRHTRSLKDAQSDNERLRADIRNGERRLSVRATCPAMSADSSASRVDDGASRAEVDPATAERVVRVANDGDDAIRQLTALQNYVRDVCLATP